MEVEQNSDWIVPENRKSKQEITPLVKSLSACYQFNITERETEFSSWESCDTLTTHGKIFNLLFYQPSGSDLQIKSLTPALEKVNQTY